MTLLFTVPCTLLQGIRSIKQHHLTDAGEGLDLPGFTKRAIRNSFIRLLNERPVSQITVKDIVEDCGINRNSFYYHY